jgi:hypothetical protein
MRVDSNDCSDAGLIRAAGADAASFGVSYERHALRVYTPGRRRLDGATSAAEPNETRQRRRT